MPSGLSTTAVRGLIDGWPTSSFTCHCSLGWTTPRRMIRWVSPVTAAETLAEARADDEV
jgi:hypothetical protein